MVHILVELLSVVCCESVMKLESVILQLSSRTAIQSIYHSDSTVSVITMLCYFMTY